MNKIRTYYDILEVEKTATQEEIKKAYTSLALKFHPDKATEKSSENESRFLEIDKAYKILRNQDKRKEYDAKLVQTQSCHVIIHDTIRIRDFLVDPDSETRYFECKCHGFYVLPDDIEESGPDVIIYCDECSLAIKVIT